MRVDDAIFPPRSEFHSSNDDVSRAGVHNFRLHLSCRIDGRGHELRRKIFPDVLRVEQSARNVLDGFGTKLSRRREELDSNRRGVFDFNDVLQREKLHANLNALPTKNLRLSPRIFLCSENEQSKRRREEFDSNRGVFDFNDVLQRKKLHANLNALKKIPDIHCAEDFFVPKDSFVEKFLTVCYCYSR